VGDFEHVYRQFAPAVLAYARRRLSSVDDAEDVVVEVFTVAWRHRDTLPTDPLPWLYATAAHTIAHTLRAETRRLRLATKVARTTWLRPEHALDDDLVNQLAAAEYLAPALATLTVSDQELLRLWAWEDLDGAQLAQVLGCTPGTARTRLHRAKARLRAALPSSPPLSGAQPQPQPHQGEPS
jgi:RNA polymerase sigma-70 factor (ECF subfamily)